jgi:hypothetical protein
MAVDDDDKPTVVLDLNALKKQKLKEEEELAEMVNKLEFAVGSEETQKSPTPKKVLTSSIETPALKVAKKKIPVVLFDFESDFFQKNRDKFPDGHEYHLATSLEELNKFLARKEPQLCVFNYDVNPKAVNSLTAQIKRKCPHIKTLIIAKTILPEKAKIHAASASGANGYYRLPLEQERIETEIQKIFA